MNLFRNAQSRAKNMGKIVQVKKKLQKALTEYTISGYTTIAYNNCRL